VYFVFGGGVSSPTSRTPFLSPEPMPPAFPLPRLLQPPQLRQHLFFIHDLLHFPHAACCAQVYFVFGGGLSLPSEFVVGVYVGVLG
jgi:hypothetical protein